MLGKCKEQFELEAQVSGDIYECLLTEKIFVIAARALYSGRGRFKLFVGVYLAPGT